MVRIHLPPAASLANFTGYRAFAASEPHSQRRNWVAEDKKDIGGTGSSNLSSSGGESGANLSLAGIRLPTSRSGGFPRVCGPGRAARSQRRAERGNIGPTGGNISVG